MKEMALQITTAQIRDNQQGPMVLGVQQQTQALLGADARQLAGVKRERSGRASLDDKMQQYAEVVEFIVDNNTQLQETVTAMLRNIGRRRFQANKTDLNSAISRIWIIADQLLSEARDPDATADLCRSKMVVAAAQYLGRQYLELVVEKEKPGYEPGSTMDPYDTFIKGGDWNKNFDPSSAHPLVWQHVYLRLRCWQLNEAVMYAQTYLPHEEQFNSLFSAWAKQEHVMNPNLPDAGDNPFKKVLYSIVLGNSQTLETQIITTSEDFVWFRMAHLYAKGIGPEFRSELSMLQSDVVNWGAASFQGFPLLYLQVLVLTQQFEQAVNYWWDPQTPMDRGDTLVGPRGIEAIHLMLAVIDTQKKSKQRLLRVTAHSDSRDHELLKECGNHEWSLNVVPLLEHFTKQFCRQDPVLAMHYLAMIPEDVTDHRSVRVNAIVDLATETRDYSRLFLSKRPRRDLLGADDYRGENTGLDGSDVLAKLLRYANCPDDATTILQASAKSATTVGNWEDAIDLYMATKTDYHRAVDTLTEQLERNYSDWRPGSRHQSLIERAQRVLDDEGLCQGTTTMHEQMSGTAEDLGQRRAMHESVRSLNKLYTIAQFFDAFEKGQQARDDLKRLEEEAKRANPLHNGQVSNELYTEPGQPLRQKREEVQSCFKHALALLAVDSGVQAGWRERPQLLPIFLSMPGLGNVRSSIVTACLDEYANERRGGVQTAIRNMVDPVVKIQQWLFQDEDKFGHPSTKQSNKSVYMATNEALKRFASEQCLIVSPEVAKALQQLATLG
jgi:hypothetical protein